MKKFILILLVLLCGCFSNKPTKTQIINSYDINTLKEKDISYRITTNQNISVLKNNSNTNYVFNCDWFIVHEDFIKSNNENQDYIIKTLKKKPSIHRDEIVTIISTLILMLFIIKLKYKESVN